MKLTIFLVYSLYYSGKLIFIKEGAKSGYVIPKKLYFIFEILFYMSKYDLEITDISIDLTLKYAFV